MSGVAVLSLARNGLSAGPREQVPENLRIDIDSQDFHVPVAVRGGECFTVGTLDTLQWIVRGNLPICRLCPRDGALGRDLD